MTSLNDLQEVNELVECRQRCTNHLQKICGLNIVQVREIRIKLERGESITSLAKEYDVEYKAIINVRDKRIFGSAK